MVCQRYGKWKDDLPHQPDSSGVCIFCGKGATNVSTNGGHQQAICRRGTQQFDAHGNPFQHMRLPPKNYCIYCGDGAPVAPPDPVKQKPSPENVWCAEHGWHKIEIDEEGKPIFPDCDMFKRHGGP